MAAIHVNQESLMRISRRIFLVNLIKVLILFAVLYIAAALIDKGCGGTCYDVKFKIAEIIGLLGFIGVILALLYSEILHVTVGYAFTDEGVYIERGIIRRYSYVVPYKSIQDIDIERGLLERVFGIGTVIINTAGVAHLKEGGPIYLHGVYNPHNFAQRILSRLKSEDTSGSSEHVKDLLEKHESLTKETQSIKESIEAIGANFEMLEERVKTLEKDIARLEASTLELYDRLATKPLEEAKPLPDEKELVKKAVEKITKSKSSSRKTSSKKTKSAKSAKKTKAAKKTKSSKSKTKAAKKSKTKKK